MPTPNDDLPLAAAVTAIDCSQECLDRTATRVAETLAKRAKAATKTGGCAGGRQDPDGDGVGAAATAARVPTNPGPADVAGPAAPEPPPAGAVPAFVEPSDSTGRWSP